MAKQVALIKGDGVGPELVEAVQIVFDSVKPKINFVECDAGYEWWQTHGGESFIPNETWEKLKGVDVCLKAPLTTPSISGSPRSVVVSIRQKFDLYANVRPIKTFKGFEGPLGEVNFVCVRETTEGLYSGLEHKIGDDAAIAIRKIIENSLKRFQERHSSSLKKEGGRR